MHQENLVFQLVFYFYGPQVRFNVKAIGAVCTLCSSDEFAVEFFKIINHKLDQSYIFKKTINGNKLSFKGGIFRFIWNGWNLFNPISSGEIEFIEEEGKPLIYHKIYFTESLFIAIIFHIIPAFAFIYEPSLSLIVIAIIWLLYTINYAISVFRFNSYISEILIKVNAENVNSFKTDIAALG